MCSSDLMALSLNAVAVSAFAPVAQAPLHSARRSSAPRCALTGDDTTDRRAVLAGLLGVALGVGGRPVSAGYVTSLGIETTKPADADRDDELLASKAVQDTIANIKGYKVSAATLKSLFSKDGNMPLIPVIRKEFDFSKVRNDLNVATTVFDDTTQATTDRLTRAILYDLTELENAARFKKGESERTEKKIANVNKWFGKLDTDFDLFLAYFA